MKYSFQKRVIGKGVGLPVATGSDLPVFVGPKDDSLDRKEFEKLWEAAVEGDVLDRLIVVCAGHLGMRASEIAHMKKDWVDFQRQTVNVPKKVGDFEAKYRASARAIPYKDLRDRVSTELRRCFDYNDAVDTSPRCSEGSRKWLFVPV